MSSKGRKDRMRRAEALAERLGITVEAALAVLAGKAERNTAFDKLQKQRAHMAARKRQEAKAAQRAMQAEREDRLMRSRNEIPTAFESNRRRH